MNNLIELLNKLGTIDYKYSLLSDKDKFNIFEILRKKDDEVHLHSRFIAELLNPNGSHGMGIEFLKEFVSIINSIKSNEGEDLIDLSLLMLDKATVEFEKYIGIINEDKTKGGRIDIIVENIGESPIIIENKIFAPDQENQLKRYFNYNNKGCFLYLTLFGDEPSEYSLGGLNIDQIIQISYKSEIFFWLEKCIEKAVKKPELREAIIQYQKLISKLTGNHMSIEEFEEVYELLAKNDNIINANLIANNWEKIRVKTELSFWQDLEKVIKEESNYVIMEKSHFSKAKITNTVKNRKGSRPYYGIIFQLGKYKGKELALKVERGDTESFYGIIIESESNKIREELNSHISKLCDHQNNHIYVGWKYLQDINFADFTTTKTLRMSNRNYRETNIGLIWNEISEFIKKCEDTFGKDYFKE